MGGVIEDHDLKNSSAACNISFREVIGRSLHINLIHSDWKKVNYYENDVRL